MAGINGLPKETLHEIVSYLSTDFSQLLKCSLVCRGLSEVANAVLYRDIDLTIFDRNDGEAAAKNQRRQLQLLGSISENPKLGAFVRTFKNHCHIFGNCQESEDATAASDTDSSMLIGAAQNMKYLSEASLSSNSLAAHIVANLPSYPLLAKLEIYGLKPEEHIWSMDPTSLTSLTWQLPQVWTSRRFGGRQIINTPNPWDSAAFLLSVVETTCPDLESLDISYKDMSCFIVLPSALPEVSAARVEQYCKVQTAGTRHLERLQHFRFRYSHGSVEQQGTIENEFTGIIGRYGDSLSSITIPILRGSWNQNTLDFSLKICGLLPRLKSLTLENKAMEGNGENSITSLDFFRTLTTDAATSNIERFSIMNMHSPFSPAMGQLFCSWKKLKFLQIGDEDNSDGPYADDGRLDHYRYPAKVKGFIKALPHSLEEVYLEINGHELTLDEDEDFDGFCEFGNDIFKTLLRLHSCDIHAWISNIDGGLTDLCEKAVFYRRLHRGPNNKIRDIWTSRMDSIYQETGILVTKKRSILELGADEGEFEGKDADEVWLGGLTSDAEGQFPRGNSVNKDGDEDEDEGKDEDEDEPDHSWPFGEDRIRTYPMFRQRN